MMRVKAMRAVAAGLLAAAMGVGAGIGASAYAKDSRSFDFQVNWSVFPDLVLARGVLAFNENAQHYTITLDANAKLSVPPVNWTGKFETKGDFSGETRQPQRFARSSRRPDLYELVVVSWREGDTPTTETTRQPAGAVVRRDPVDPADITDVVDPLSFGGLMLDAVRSTNGRSCALEQKTWDGARLATMRVETKESVLGARVDCRLVYGSLAGLRADTPWRVREDTTERVIRFEKALGKWSPVSIKISGVFVGFKSTFTTVFKPRS